MKKDGEIKLLFEERRKGASQKLAAARPEMIVQGQLCDRYSWLARLMRQLALDSSG